VAARGQADEHLLQGHAASVAAHFNVSLETPWKDLPEDFKKVLLHGSGDGGQCGFSFWRAGKVSTITVRLRACCRTWNGSHRERKRIHPQPAQGLHEPAVLRRLQGRRLKPEILAVTLGSERVSRPLFQGRPPETSNRRKPQN
jgi:excinuclease ABC subunit A